MLEQLFERLKSGNLTGLQGTDLAIELPIAVSLIQEILDQRPNDNPLTELNIQLLSDNRAIIELAADVPVLGEIKRVLSLRISGAYNRSFPDLIYIDIVDGLKMFDKPIINLLQNQVADKLPAGIEFNAQQITVDLPKLLQVFGYGYLLGLLAGGKLVTRPNQLVVQLNLKA